MRKYPVSCLIRKSHVPRENLMSYQFWVPPNEKISCLPSHEKISCLKRKSHVLSVWGPPPKRKFPVSSLIRKSHVSRENLMSYQFWAPPNEKISCLLSHEKISCLKRKSHVLSVFGPPPTRKSPVSCLMRKSRVPRENLMSFQFWPPPQ